MLKEDTPRCIQLMEQSVKSEVTKKSYKRELRVFLEFTKLKDYDELVSLEPKQFQILLENYIMHLKRRCEKGDIRARSFIPPIAAIESFCVQNDIILNFKKVKKWIPKFEKLTGEKPYTNDDIQKMLQVANLRMSVVIHIFASTGIRPDALPHLKLRDMESIEDGCTKLVIYPEDSEEYVAFLTPEATTVLQKYLEKRKFDGEKLTEDSPLVRNAYQETEGWRDIEPVDISSLYGSFALLLRKAGLRKPKKQLRERHEKRIFYGFRKRYNTILKDNKMVNANTAEKLMGHKNGLEQTQSQNSTISYPVEIGNYLMKKLVLHPNSYQACQDVILHYEQNDLYKILESLSDSVQQKLHDKTAGSLKELDIILDNAWKDAKHIESRKELIQDGISVILGSIGLLVTSALSGNLLGLLAGLCFNVVDRRLDMQNWSLSDKLSRSISNGYLVNIFDFQKKHNLYD